MDNHVEQLIKCEESCKSAHKRLDGHEDRITKLEDTYSIMEKMDYRMGNVEKSISSINSKLEKKEESKGMKWDKLIDYLFYAFVAYILIQIGLK